MSTSNAMPQKIAHNALIVVADGTRARFFRNSGNQSKISLAVDGALQQVHLGKNGLTGKSPPERSKHGTEATFEKQLANELNRRAQSGEFVALVLIADPQTLSQIRPSLHQDVRSRLVWEIAETLTKASIADIEAALDYVMPLPDSMNLMVVQTGADGMPARPLRVLLVEDEPELRELFHEVLVGMGYAVCAMEATEADAVAAALRCRPDVMLVDVQLGAGSGVSAVATILCSGFIPHVFYSGDISRVHALCPGAIALQKPFRIRDLARAMDCALAAPARCGHT